VGHVFNVPWYCGTLETCPTGTEGTFMFSPRIALSELVDLCRVMRLQLSAGLPIHEVLKKQGERGRAAVREVCARLADRIAAGTSVADAVELEGDVFPPIFLSMLRVGETTGHLAEIFGELEKYFELELDLVRQFRSQTFFPILQFVAAVLVIAGVIFLLGMIAEMTRSAPLITIFGLGGGAGAAAFLGIVVGTLFIIWLIYFILTTVGHQQVWMDRFLLGIPFLGPCLYALVMSRFTLALRLTLDSGLSILKAVRLSLEATGDAYFISHADDIVLDLKNGKTLLESLEASGLFTIDFLDMVASSETSGSVPEMMKHLALQYQEETARQMTFLTRIAAGFVWCCVAGFIIWGIFRLASIYLGALEGRF